MKSNPPLLPFLIACIFLSACNAAAVPELPTTTASLPPTETPSPLPTETFTPQPTPTLATLTPTPGAPAAVENIMVKKKRCTVKKLTDPYLHYEVEISFLLQWADVQGEEGYWLVRNGSRVAELPADTTLFTDYFNLVKPNRTSTYVIAAFNALGKSESPQFSFANPC